MGGRVDLSNVPSPPVDLADQPSFRLDTWRVEPSRLLLVRGDEELRLEPRVMALLVELVSRHGEVLSRTHLLDTVWSEVTVGDDALTMAMSKLRRALGRRAAGEGADFVETIPRVGYRLIAAPRFDPRADPPATDARVAGEGSGGSADQLATARFSQAKSRPARAGLWVTLFVVAGLVAAFAFLGPERLGPQDAERSTEPGSGPDTVPPVRHLTSTPGLESQASFDPAGERIVFQTAQGLYILELATGEQSVLFEGFASTPEWSPTEPRIAFVEHESQGGPRKWLSIVSASGGPVKRLREIRPSLLVGIGWSPDGRSLWWSEKNDDLAAHAIVEMDLESGHVVPWTEPDVEPLGDARPAVSPDGRFLAFVRGADHLSYDLWLLDLETRELRRLTDDGRRVWGLTWWPDSRGLVFSSNRSGPFQLWSLEIATEDDTSLPEPRWLPTLEGQARFPVLQRDQLVFDAFEVPADIFELRAPTDEATVPSDELPAMTEPIRPDTLGSKARESSPSWSPDGRRLAFGSDRGGKAELWIAEDGAIRQVSQLGASLFYELGWSPDSRSVAVRVERGGAMEIHRIDVETGASRCLRTSNGLVAAGPVFDPAGERVYITIQTRSTPEIWSLDAVGDAAPTRWAEGLAIRFDDDRTAYALSAQAPLLLRRAADGRWSIALQRFHPSGWSTWTLRGGFVHALHAEEGMLVWRVWDLATGSNEIRARFPLGRFENGKIALHPDGDALLVAFFLPMESDLRWRRWP